MWQPKPLEDIEPRFHCAISFLKTNKEGTYEWDNMSQHRASTQLAKLMMWDQSILDQNPALNFHFGAIQEKPYVPPSKGADISFLEKSSDEVDELTH